MSIRIPNLPNDHAVGLVVCTQLDPKKNAALLTVEDGSAVPVVPLKLLTKPYFARLLRNSRGHFHVELAAASQFRVKPERTTTRRDFEELVEQAFGQEARAKVIGTYRLAFERVPKHGIIRAYTDRTTVSGVTLRMTAGSIELEGSAVSRINWRSLSNDEIEISVMASRTVGIKETFLCDAHEWISRLFRVTVLNEPQGITQ